MDNQRGRKATAIPCGGKGVYDRMTAAKIVRVRDAPLEM